MRKIYCLLLALLLIALFPACDVIDSKDKTTENKAPSVVTEDDSYEYYSELISFDEFSSKPYVSITIDIPLVKGIRPSITLIDDNLIAYTTTNNDPKTDESFFSELGMLDLHTQKYIPLVTLDNGFSVAAYETINANYIVWMEGLDGASWLKTKLHLYDRANEQDNIIYESAGVAMNFNSAVLLNDIVYFDDIVGERNGMLESNIFGYDIAKGKVSLISPMAKLPSIYQGRLAFLTPETQGNGSSLSIYENEQINVVASFDSRDVATVGVSGNHILLNKRNFDIDDPEAMTSSKLHLDDSAIPILSGKDNVYTFSPKTNNQFVVWAQSCPGKPVFYDILKDQFVKLDQEPDDMYAAFLTNDKLVFISEKDDEPTRCIIIT